MSFCPFCGVRQDVNLRQIHFRDLGTDASLPCPHCATPLDVIEFDTEPKVRIERCTTCYGTFFNPGELELLLDAGTNPLVWLDPVQLKRISEDFGYNHDAFLCLPPDLREAMTLFAYEGMGYAEIATVSQCSSKAVETRIYRARQLLRDQLKGLVP